MRRQYAQKSEAGAKTVVYITARGLGSVIDGSVCPGCRLYTIYLKFKGLRSASKFDHAN